MGTLTLVYSAMLESDTHQGAESYLPITLTMPLVSNSIRVKHSVQQWGHVG